MMDRTVKVSDSISRQIAIDLIESWSGGYDYIEIPTDAAVKQFEQLPSAQPERKVGKWEVHDILDHTQRASGRKILRCPFCGYLTDDFRSRVDYYHKLTHFCPNCGAEMTGGERRTDE